MARHPRQPWVVPRPGQRLIHKFSYGFLTELGPFHHMVVYPRTEPDQDDAVQFERDRSCFIDQEHRIAEFSGWVIDEFLDAHRDDDTDPDDAPRYTPWACAQCQRQGWRSHLPYPQDPDIPF